MLSAHDTMSNVDESLNGFQTRLKRSPSGPFFTDHASPPVTPTKSKGSLSTKRSYQSFTLHPSPSPTLLSTKLPIPDDWRNGLSGTASPVDEQSNHHFANAQSDEDDVPYPADHLGEEMSSHARVWRTYIREGTRFDIDMVNGMNHSLDVLLVFAGLFSAVVTTFVVQSSLSLQPDYTQMSLSLLTESIALQRAAAEGISASSVPSTGDLVSSFRPSFQSRLVNSLWYISLALSLTSAFMSMLVKQWLQAYTHNISGSPRERARLRHFRFMGLKAWHVPGLVAGLPVLMHMSLLLFFLGMIELLATLDEIISWILTGVVALAYFTYLASTFIPLFNPQCPYKTPLSENLLRLWGRTGQMLRHVHHTIMQRKWSGLPSTTPTPTPRRLPGHHESLKEKELTRIQKIADSLDANAVSWLFTACADESVVSVALQAMAGLRRDFKGFKVLHAHDAQPLVERALQLSMPNADKCTSSELEKAERYGRALLHLASSQGPVARIHQMASIKMYRRLSEMDHHPDVSVLASCALIRCAKYGLKTIHHGMDILRRVAEGDIHISEYTLVTLLESIADSVVTWALPFDIVPTSKAVLTFTQLYEISQPPFDSELGSAFALAFYLCVHPQRTNEQNIALQFSEHSRPQKTYGLIIQTLVAVLGKLSTREAPEDVTPLAVKQLTSITLAILKSNNPVDCNSSSITHIDQSVSILTGLFTSGRLIDYGLSESTMADVLLLLSLCWDRMPFDDANFLHTLIRVLHTSELEDTLMRSLVLIRGCATECSPDLCRAFLDSEGLHKLLKFCTSAPRLASIAGLVLCALATSVATNHRQHHSVDHEMDSLFESQAVTTICTRAGSQKLSLFEVHKHWLPPLVQLCHIRPEEPVWLEALTTFITPVRDLVRKEESMAVDPEDRTLELGRSIIATLDEMVSLIKTPPSDSSSVHSCQSL